VAGGGHFYPTASISHVVKNKRKRCDKETPRRCQNAGNIRCLNDELGALDQEVITTNPEQCETRLATATMNHENAKKNVESARGNMDNSRDKVKAVEVQLKETEEILTVIDVDVLSPAAASPKRRKVPVLSTEGIHTAVPQIIVAPAAATAVQSSHGIGDIMGAATISNDAAATRASNGNDSGSLEIVVVEGHGLP
jgi:hypothetical protein